MTPQRLFWAFIVGGLLAFFATAEAISVDHALGASIGGLVAGFLWGSALMVMVLDREPSTVQGGEGQ